MAGKESGGLSCLIYARKQRQWSRGTWMILPKTAQSYWRTNCKQVKGSCQTLKLWALRPTTSPELYFKKLSSKHQELAVVETELVINQKWLFLGASPDRIRFCKCHGKTLVECKSPVSKRNLLPGIAATEKLRKTTKGFQLKEETTWYYQIQGQIAITGIHHTDLVIYTNKGILIVSVEFNAQFWLRILDKLHFFWKFHGAWASLWNHFA